MSPSRLTIFLAFTLLLLTLTVEGQTPSCAQSLVPCANYINSTSPPSSCCDPLKDAIKTQLTCLCNLYNTPGLLESFGINITDAISLPARCKLSGDLNSCVKASGPASSQSPPASTPGNDKDGVSKTTGMGMLSVLLLSAFVAFL